MFVVALNGVEEARRDPQKGQRKPLEIRVSQRMPGQKTPENVKYVSMIIILYLGW